MVLVLDAAVHMRAAGLAGVALDHGRRIDDLQLIAIFEHGQVLTWHDRDHRENGARRLPAFGATAGMVVGDVALDADLDRLVLAFADQRPAGKAAGAFLYTAVNRWVELNSHGSILLCA